MRHLFILLFVTLQIHLVFGQSPQLQAGFSVDEYSELLKVSTRQGDSLYNSLLPAPERFSRLYRSEVLGMDNRWELWTSGDDVAAISVRGTTLHLESWIENLYAAMLPAKGTLRLGGEEIAYCLSQDERASVHAGWLIGAVALYQDILPRIDSCMQEGVKDFYLVGHSQGGAICYLLTSMLHELKENDERYDDIRLKTYASAAPKPGNLYYAHDYEAKTQMGFAFNVVNSADWVPEGPFTIQTIDDYNTSNPFEDAYDKIKEAPFPKRVFLKYAFKKLDLPTRKASKSFNRYLGEYMKERITDYLPGLEHPDFVKTTNYVRTGNIIVLKGDEDYSELFPDLEGQIWQHHKFEAYFYLLDRIRL